MALKMRKEGIVIEDKMEGKFSKTICECGEWLRPDIIWFEDMLKEDIIAQANQKIIESDLFISIGNEWNGLACSKLSKPCKIFRIILYRDKSRRNRVVKPL